MSKKTNRENIPSSYRGIKYTVLTYFTFKKNYDKTRRYLYVCTRPCTVHVLHNKYLKSKREFLEREYFYEKTQIEY